MTARNVVARWDEAGELHEQQVRTPEEGLALFDRVHRSVETPTLIGFSPAGSDEFLFVGVGRPMSVLSFQDSLDPPYFGSQGDGAEDQGVSFMFSGAYSEFPNRQAVSIDTARQAVEEYLSTGHRPTVIEWNEV